MEEKELVSSITEKLDGSEAAEHGLGALLDGLDLSGGETEEGSQEAEEESQDETEVDSADLEDETEDVEETEEESEAEEEESEDGDEETEEEESDDDSDDDELEGSKRVQKRIDKLTRLRREAEEKAKALEEEVAELRNQQVLSQAAPVDKGEFDHLETLQDVQKAYDEAAGVIEWAEDNPDGAIVTRKDGTETEYSADEIKQIKRAAQRARERGLPARFEYLKGVSHWNNVAAEKYPDLIKSDSKLSKEVERVASTIPALRQRPDYKLMIADWVRGRELREAEEKAAKDKASGKITKKPIKKPKKVPIKRQAAPSAKRQRARLTKIDEGDLAGILLDDGLV